MDVTAAHALLAELELHEVEDLGTEYFEAELADHLDLARPRSTAAPSPRPAD